MLIVALCVILIGLLIAGLSEVADHLGVPIDLITTLMSIGVPATLQR
jgi:hypothetical protein